MSRPAPPALTVRYDGSTRTFAAGNDVVIGRDLRADVRVAHPLISRAHLVLRFDQGRWVAIDNGSLNGMYANGRRVPTRRHPDGQQINIGNPDGPGLTFEVGRHHGSAGAPPQTTAVRLATLPSAARPAQPPPQTSRPQTYPPSTLPPQPPVYPPGPQPRYPSGSSGIQRSDALSAEHSPARPAGPCRGPISRPRLESVTAMGPTAAPRSTEGTSRRAC